ncbi:MAG TPA: two-component regulator propeller domain-containing protein [Vicinamibacterales bacterium]|nr:two-component regulator propeller domain-containing protein [Vicinamibacterales bacterium]
MRNSFPARALALLLLLTATVPPVGAERLPVRTYTTADGLAHVAVERIVPDSHGFLWFCTPAGLSRFDGYGFINFSAAEGLPIGRINDLIETRRGEYWLGSEAGLVRFDPEGVPSPHLVTADRETGSRRPMFTLVDPGGGDRYSTTVTALAEGADGTLWIGTRQGLARLDRSGGRLRVSPIEIGLPDRVPEEREVGDLLEDRWGTLWITTPVGLSRRWPDGRVARYSLSDGLPGKYLTVLTDAGDGSLWVGSRDAGAFRITADAQHRPLTIGTKLSSTNGLPHDWVLSILRTADDRIWIGTARGLAEVSGSKAITAAVLRAYTARNGLSHPAVSGLAEDAAGNIWIASSEAGAVKLSRNGLTTYGAADGLEAVHSVFQDRAGQICFRGHLLGDALSTFIEGVPLPLGGAPAGGHIRFGCLNEQRFHAFLPAAVKPEQIGWVMEAVTLQARDGTWWVGTDVGLVHFPATERFEQIASASPLAVYVPSDGLAAGLVFRLFEDSRGDIWISTISSAIKGLARWDHRDAKVHDLGGRPGLPSLVRDTPRSFGEDASGGIWIGFNSGLARYRDDRFTFFTPADGLPAGTIVDFHRDGGGRFWVASARGGLVRVDEVTAARPRFVTYSTADGLSSNNIETLTGDRRGLLYLGGGNGLDRFDPESGRVKHYTAADGLPPGIIKDAFLDRAGVLWFGTSSGLARLAPGDDLAAAPPIALISALHVGGQSRPVSALGARRLSIGPLPPSQNQVRIDFVGLGFGGGEVLSYQYQLEGGDARWSAPTGQRSITFASLAPGEYAFHVRAVNSEGVASAPATVAFAILRPVWLRGWFLMLAAAAIGAAAYAAHHYRVSRVLQLARMRTSIATDLHDDIGANLTRIALLSEVARTTRDDVRLASIAQIARESIGSMGDIVWAINPARESLRDLVRRMRQHADELFTQREIALRFDVPAAAADRKLTMEARRDWLLIFKEAVSNVARHSRCSQVAIEIRLEESQLVMVVADNGIGLDPAKAGDGQGLRSLQRRAAALRGTCVITSRPGRGTSVTVKAPV